MLDVRSWLRDNSDRIRFTDEDGCKWYVTVDIAELLGYSHPSKAARRMIERNQAWFEDHIRIVKTVHHECGLTRTNLALDEEAVEMFLRRASTAQAQEIRDHYYRFDRSAYPENDEIADND